MVTQSWAGSPLGRMTFKLRMSMMRSCQPGKVLGEAHSKQEEEQVQRPTGRQELGCEGPLWLKHVDECLGKDTSLQSRQGAALLRWRVGGRPTVHGEVFGFYSYCNGKLLEDVT